MNQANGINGAGVLMACLVAGVGLVGGFFVWSGMLWLACKTVRESRPISRIFAAIGTCFGMTFILNICLGLINKAVAAAGFPEVALFMALASIPVVLFLCATIYAQTLEMDLGKAILAMILQNVYSLPLCCIFIVPVMAINPQVMTELDGVIAKLNLQPQPQALPNNGVPPAAPQVVVPPDPIPVVPSTPGPFIENDVGPPTTIVESPVPNAVPEPSPADMLIRPDSTLPASNRPDSAIPDFPTPDATSSSSSSSDASPAVAGLKGEAQKAFARGRFEEGYNFLYADAIAGDDRDAWNKIRYCPGLGRPVLGVRWGLGVQLTGKIPPAMLGPATGSVSPPIGLQPAPGANGFAPAGGAGQAPAGPGLSNVLAPPIEAAPAELTALTGEIGGRLLNVLPASGMSAAVGGPVPEAAEYIGKSDDLPGLMQAARNKGIDALLVTLLTVKVQGLNKQVDVTMTVRVFDVATEKRLWSSSPLSHNKARADKLRGLDPGGDIVRGLTDFINANFLLQNSPRLDGAKVLERAEAISSGEPANALAALMEVRYYQTHGALKESDAGACYRKLVGLNNGEAMTSGTSQDRRQVIERFLPPSE